MMRVRACSTRAAGAPRRRARASHPAAATRRLVAVATGVLTIVILPAAMPTRASGAFERSVGPSAVDAVCGAGPRSELVDLLTRREQEIRWSLGATSMELYGLPELRGVAVSVSRISPGARVSVGVSSFGCDIYREQTLEVAGTRRWSQDAAVGFRGRALCMAWEGGVPTWTGAVDLSCGCLVHGRLVIGLSVRNVTRAGILSSPVASGVSGDAALVLDRVTVLASVVGAPGFGPSPAVGCELALAPWARIRGGIQTGVPTAACGLCLGGGRRLRPDVDLAWIWHPVLGSSYSLTVSIRA